MSPAPDAATLLREPVRRTVRSVRRPVVRHRRGQRAVDLLLGVPLFLATLPVQVLLALASAAALRAWPLFRQVRPGEGEAPFHILKIRTLPRSVPSYGHKDELDAEMARVPAVCAFLRRTHLDELPQLGLVVLGRMSLVGPRPSQPLAFEQIDEGFEVARTAVRPGCTGLWQIGCAHDASLSADPRYDLYYLEHGSLALDLWVLARTPLFLAGLVGPVAVEDIPSWTRRHRRDRVVDLGAAGPTTIVLDAVPVGDPV